jgi:TPR repeat protein
MKPRTPGFWLIVATVGLLALLPMQAFAGMTPEEVKMFTETKAKAEKGDAENQGFVGGCYYYGAGVTKDYAEAAKWFRKAAEQGDALSQVFLGDCYESGKGVPKNLTESLKWHRKAADQGDTQAQSNLAVCYFKGLGVEKDYVEAYAYFNLASSTDEDARNKRGMLEKRMSQDDVLRGQKRAMELQKEIEAKIAAKKAGK